MACFLIPAAEAVITTVATKVIKSKEKEETMKVSFSDGTIADATKIKFSTKLGWLNKLLWGGSALLAFEHVWHGEVVPFFPFLTAASSPQQFTAMLKEMATVGVTMALFVTFVWVVMTLVTFKMQLPHTKVSEEVHS